MALVGFSAQQCVRRPWSTSWRVSGWDDLGDYQQSGALSITTDETDAQPGGSTQATIIADGSAFTINGSALPGWVSTAGTRNLVCLVIVGNTLHASANGETLARAMGLAGIAGAGSVVLGQITSTAAGTVLSGRVGVASVTLGAVVSTAAGVVGPAPRVGTASVTLGAVTSTAAGTVASAVAETPVTSALTAAFASSTAGGAAPNISIGQAFVVSAAGHVDAIWVYVYGSDMQSKAGSTVALYASKAATSPLASATFTSAATNGWQRVALSSPVSVTAAQEVVAAYFVGGGSYFGVQKSATSFTSSNITSAHVTVANNGNGCYGTTGSAIGNPYPGGTAAGTGSGAWYGVDVEYVAS